LKENAYIYINKKIRDMVSKSKKRSLLVIVFLIFLTLKLAGIGMVATWGWLAVFSPLIAKFILVLIGAIIETIIELKK
tara:strand:+ start:365 stop:598 length:234 start_codon:yes stop_codon:yes gene_type:complete